MPFPTSFNGTNSQKGFAPLIMFGIIFFVIMIIVLSALGLNTFFANRVVPVITSQPTPTPTPQNNFIKVDITLDQNNPKIIYCNEQYAENVQQEYDQYKIELTKSEICLTGYDQYAEERKLKLTTCSDSCDTTYKSELKKCTDDYNNKLISDYDLNECTKKTDETMKQCTTDCNQQHKVASNADYNRACQQPAIDQNFRLNDLVTQYCQQNPN